MDVIDGVCIVKGEPWYGIALHEVVIPESILCSLVIVAIKSKRTAALRWNLDDFIWYCIVCQTLSEPPRRVFLDLASFFLTAVWNVIMACVPT